MSYSLLRKAEEVTGWTHGQLADLVGYSRPQIQAVISGRTPEYLNARQTQALMAAVRLYVEKAQQGLEELERFT